MRIFKGFLKKISWHRDQSGVTLLESLVAIGILGGGVLVMVFAMSGGALAVGENGQEVTIQELARSQMEYIKSCAYNPSATTYPAISAPEGYSISVGVKAVPSTNTNIQKVSANISRNGTLLMAVTDYKVNR
jgi:Tfp pilus assembly protein PilV